MNTACMLLLAAAVNAPPNLSVAILDYQDTWNTTKGLGQLLDDLSQPHTDLTAATLAGNPITLTGSNTFIIGGFCTQNQTIRAALTTCVGRAYALAATSLEDAGDKQRP